MLLRAMLRPLVNPQNRIQLLRMSWKGRPKFDKRRPAPSSSAWANAPSSNSEAKCHQEDLPVDMPNPFQKERTQCILCKHNIEPDYKNVRLLSQFQSSFTGRIYGRHITGLCRSKQEKVEQQITNAQNCVFMGYYHKDVTYLKDAKLFDPERPIRPHKY